MIYEPHMKMMAINPDSANREALDERIRWLIHDELHCEKVSANEVVFLLSRILAEIAAPAFVTGHLACAFELAAKKKIKPLMGTDAVGSWVGAGLVPAETSVKESEQ